MGRVVGLSNNYFEKSWSSRATISSPVSWVGKAVPPFLVRVEDFELSEYTNIIFGGCQEIVQDDHIVDKPIVCSANLRGVR